MARSANAMLARAVVAAAESLGAPREPLLAALGLRWDDLCALDVRVSRGATEAMWVAIEKWSGDPLIALAITREIGAAGGAALFQYTVRSAPTIADAWARLVPLLALFFGDGFEVITRSTDAGWELGYRLPLGADGPVPRSEEAIVAGFVLQCRAVAPAFDAAAVCFQHGSTAPAAAWRRALGCSVELEASFYGVRVTERSYRAAIPGHDASLSTLIDSLARPLVAAPTAAAGPAEAVGRVMRDLLDQRAAVTLDAVAAQLHVSRRTLQRQLAAAGTSLTAELERVRREIALALLRDSSRTVAEIAAQLGFADPSQFTRAVRRWTGETPTELRAKP